MRKILDPQDYVGKKYNRLFIISFSHTKDYRKHMFVRCDCGKELTVPLSSILSEHNKSCGCLSRELSSERGKTSNLKHGMFGKPTYKSWSHMISRCYTPNDKKFPRYGGRGITVCDRWRGSFENFLEDMGVKPADEGNLRYTLGRIDNDGDYCKENCRWETPSQQSNNRSTCKSITINGETLNRTQWIKKLGINYGTVIGRIQKGWSEYDALTTPLYKRINPQHTSSEVSPDSESTLCTCPNDTESYGDS